MPPPVEGRAGGGVSARMPDESDEEGTRVGEGRCGEAPSKVYAAKSRYRPRSRCTWCEAVDRGAWGCQERSYVRRRGAVGRPKWLVRLGCGLGCGRGAVGVAEGTGLDWVAAWSVVAERWDVRGAWCGWVAASVVVAKRGRSNRGAASMWPGAGCTTAGRVCGPGSFVRFGWRGPVVVGEHGGRAKRGLRPATDPRWQRGG